MQKLKEIVEGMISGGWLKDKTLTYQVGVFNPVTVKVPASECKSFKITTYDGIRITAYHSKSGRYLLVWEGSISDLLSSHPAMKALLGDVETCPICGSQTWSKVDMGHSIIRIRFCTTLYCTGKKHSSLPAYIYHIREAFTLPTDKERVEYVYRVWKGEK